MREEWVAENRKDCEADPKLKESVRKWGRCASNRSALEGCSGIMDTKQEDVPKMLSEAV